MSELPTPSLRWVEITSVSSLPPQGVEVLTKIHDAQGCRNEQTLKRRGALWFVPDESIYVYYRPTHWAPLS